LTGKCVLTAVASATAIAVSLKFASRKIKESRLRQVIEEWRQQRKQEEKELEEKLAPLEEQQRELWDTIVHLSYKDLKSGLSSGEISALDALRAYQWSSLKVNTKVNCITQYIVEAEELALALDQVPAEKRGPLHGVPISIKDSFLVKGCKATSGLVQFLDLDEETDGLTVQLVKEMGGVPFCITNVPQSCLTMQCSNPIYGYTGNPYGADKDCGGSSGGEGALIGGGGSIMGIGNDIGGSLRCPAAVCGIYSLKPTVGRHISNRGIRRMVPANLTIKVSSGFMSASADGLVDGFKSMWNNDKLYLNDNDMAPVKWRDDVFNAKQKLKIGFNLENGFYNIHPSCHRAVLEAKSMLEAAGHQVVEFPLPDVESMIRHFSGFIYADNFVNLSTLLDREGILDPAVVGVRKYATIMQSCPKWVTQYIINGFLSLITVLRLYPQYDSIPLLMEKASECAQLSQQYVDKMNAEEIDLLLIPGSMIPAPKKGFFGRVPSTAIAYSTWNTLNFPAGIVPITHVNSEDQAQMKQVFPDNDTVYNMMREACSDSEGMPVAVQVVGRKYDEEKVLRLMSELEKLAGFKQLKDSNGKGQQQQRPLVVTSL